MLANPFFFFLVMGPESRLMLPSISILLPPLPTRRALRTALSAVFRSVIGEREMMMRAHLVECRHGFVGAADLDLVEEGLGAGAVFAGALSCACEDRLAWEEGREGRR